MVNRKRLEQVAQTQGNAAAFSLAGQVIDELRNRVRDLEQGLQAIKVRCEEGDPRVDWKPNFIATVDALLGK